MSTNTNTKKVVRRKVKAGFKFKQKAIPPPMPPVNSDVYLSIPLFNKPEQAPPAYTEDPEAVTVCPPATGTAGGAEARRKLTGKRKWQLRGFETEEEAFAAYPGHYTKGMTCGNCGKEFRAKTPKYLHDSICDGELKISGADRMRMKKEQVSAKNDIATKIKDALKLLKIQAGMPEIEGKTTKGLIGWLQDDYSEDWDEITGVVGNALWTDRESIREIIREWIEAQADITYTVSYTIPGMGRQKETHTKTFKEHLMTSSTNAARLYAAESIIAD